MAMNYEIEFCTGRLELPVPGIRDGCCVCEMRGSVKRLIKRVAELERKQAAIEGRLDGRTEV